MLNLIPGIVKQTVCYPLSITSISALDLKYELMNRCDLLNG